MRFNVFGRKIGENKRVHVCEFMAEEAGPFRGHLNNGKVAFVFGRAAEHFLYEKPAGHSHLIQIPLLLFADFKSQGGNNGGGVPGFFQNGVYEFNRAGFTLGAGYSQYENFPSGGNDIRERSRRPENNDKPAEKTGKVF